MITRIIHPVYGMNNPGYHAEGCKDYMSLLDDKSSIFPVFFNKEMN